jgi:hypothetical protein
MKGKKKAPSSSEEEEAEDDDDDDDDQDDQPSTSSSKDEDTARRIGKVMGMICKINLMGVPYRSRIFSLTLTRKSKEREDASHARRRATSGTTV